MSNYYMDDDSNDEASAEDYFQSIFLKYQQMYLKNQEIPLSNQTKKEIYIGSNKLCLEIGSLIDAKYDVIVNSTKPDLNLDCGTLSKAILEAAGNAIQKECQMLYPNGITIEDVAITSSGEMNKSIDTIFHVTATDFKDNISCVISVERIINNCLDTLNELKLTSIAFPCLGTGALKYPVQLVAETMISRFFSYLNSNNDLNLLIGIVIPEENDQTIKTFISEFVKLEHYLLKEANAKHAEQTVQWKYEIKPKIWIDFSAHINTKLQNGFKEKKNEIAFLNDEKIQSLVCFKSMTYTELDEEHIRSFKIKKETSKKDIDNNGKLNYPKNWKKMIETIDFELVNVDPSSKEYKEVVDSFKLHMSHIELIYVKVERVQCKSLYEAYLIHKKKLRKKNFNENEMLLWHGTSDESVESICKFGFNRSYCGINGVKFGKGVYFATSSAYSHKFTDNKCEYGERKMIRARVLVGESTIGNEETIVPPLKNNDEPYDSTCDPTKSIFVCYHDSQCYPEYLISYTSC